jgi:4-hydroxy-tetrahydrodipicolinate reductase
MRLGIVGLTGRMGRAVLELAAAAPDIELVAGFVRPQRDREVVRRSLPIPVVLTDDLPQLMEHVDVVIDFSHPDLTATAARAAAAAGVAFVSGTTGLTPEHWAALHEAGERIPLVHAANFSFGIALLQRLLPELVRVLEDWDIELIERHHRAKRDAPSGTALALARAIGTARAAPGAELVFGRDPGTPPRRSGEVGVHAVRAGGEVGRHTVLLASDDEGLEITHWAQSRRAYAAGALAAARRLAGRPPGLYAFSDLLFA